MSQTKVCFSQAEKYIWNGVADLAVKQPHATRLLGLPLAIVQFVEPIFKHLAACVEDLVRIHQNPKKYLAGAFGHLLYLPITPLEGLIKAIKTLFMATVSPLEYAKISAAEAELELFLSAHPEYTEEQKDLAEKQLKKFKKTVHAQTSKEEVAKLNFVAGKELAKKTEATGGELQRLEECYSQIIHDDELTELSMVGRQYLDAAYQRHKEKLTKGHISPDEASFTVDSLRREIKMKCELFAEGQDSYQSKYFELLPTAAHYPFDSLRCEEGSKPDISILSTKKDSEKKIPGTKLGEAPTKNYNQMKVEDKLFKKFNKQLRKNTLDNVRCYEDMREQQQRAAQDPKEKPQTTISLSTALPNEGTASQQSVFAEMDQKDLSS
jgi:hypothetical protein